VKIEVTGVPEWISKPRLPNWAAKASRILAVVLDLLALGATILLAVLMQPALTSGIPLFVLLDEFDDLLEAIFLLGIGSAVCAWIAHVLQNRIRNSQNTQNI